MKKLAAILLIMCMTVGLMVGCGGGQTPAATNPPASSPPTLAPEQGGSPTQAPEAPETGYDFGEYSADNPLTLRISHFSNETSWAQHISERFKTRIEEWTEGAVEVVIYSGGVLGNDRESLDSVIAGTLEMAVNNTPIMSNYSTTFQVLDLGYLFEDYEGIYKFLDSDIAQELMSSMDSTGAKLLCLQVVGYRNFDMCFGPVRTPDDLKGRKIRVTDSPIYMADYEAWGANPLIIAGPETITALQQGTIDGADNTNDVQYANKYTEFAKYITVSEHATHFGGLTMNLNLYNSLTPDLQMLISKAAQEAAVEGTRVNETRNNELLKNLEEEDGGIISYDIDKQAFKDALADLYEDFRANHPGGKYLEGIEELINK